MSKIADVIERLFNIYDKEGNLVPFKLNTIQRSLDHEIIELDNKRASILKFRQGGVTTFIMAWFLVECMNRHCTAVMLAHDREHTERLLERAQLMLKNMNLVKPKTSKMNENEIFFSKTQSSFYIGTAGSSTFGRSATISHLHCSEIAFWREPKTLLTGLLQAVPHESGTIIQETTGNGYGTWFQQQYYTYMEGKGRFKPLFFPWFIHNEYQSNTLDLSSFLFTPEEAELAEKFSLSPFQLNWRREKIEEFDGDLALFNQEYPSTVEECFRLTGGSLFGQVKNIQTSSWRETERGLFLLEGHPRKEYSYIIGADSSGGTGRDNAAAEVLCFDTKEQVGEFADNRLAPPKFAERLISLGRLFNYAYLVPETNSHGLSVLSIVKDKYPKDRIYKHIVTSKGVNAVINIPSIDYGWKTTSITKPYMVGVAQRLLLEEGVKLYSPFLINELLSMTETETGRIEGIGENDDRAIAFMLSCIGYLKLLRNIGYKPLSDEPIIETTPKLHSWRNLAGDLLIPFKDSFGYKSKETGKRSIHCQ